MVMRDLDSLENYDRLWDDVWLMPKDERDDNGKVASGEGLAAESD
jgi:hypothetical protein